MHKYYRLITRHNYNDRQNITHPPPPHKKRVSATPAFPKASCQSKSRSSGGLAPSTLSIMRSYQTQTLRLYLAFQIGWINLDLHYWNSTDRVVNEEYITTLAGVLIILHKFLSYHYPTAAIVS